MIYYTGRDEELRILGPAVIALGFPDRFRAHRIAVRLGGAGDRRAPADHAVDDDQRWSVLRSRRNVSSALRDSIQVVGVRDVQDIPAIAAKPLRHAFAEGERRSALDRDVVIVVDPTKVRQLEMPGERCRLARHAFHHVAIAAQGVDVVVEQRGAVAIEMLGEPAFRERHSDRIPATLTERAGGRFDAGGDAIFGMAGGLGVELPKLPEIVEADRRLAGMPAVGVDLAHAGKVQQRIKEQRRVADRQHEPIAIGPVGAVRVVAQEPAPQDIAHGRHAHRRSGMARGGLLDRVEREGPDGVDRELVEGRRRALT